MKYKLGDKVYWIYSSTNYSKKIPCTMCFGKRFVTIILGDESQTKISCGFCESGFEGSTGQATVWEPIAVVRVGTISGVSTSGGIKYEIGSELLYEHELFDNENDAQIQRAIKFKEVSETAKKYFEDSFVNCTKKQVWSAGYHKRCIESNKKNIEWHELRLGILKETP